MTLTKVDFNEYTEPLLLQVQLVFGSTIANSGDCERLSDDILKKTNKALSSQTLRRVFRLIKSQSSISRYTADVLCQYCGYLTIDQFLNTTTTEIDQDKLYEANIYQDFFDIEVKEISKGYVNEEYFNAISKILKRIYGDINLYESLMPKLAGNKTAQNYLFEQFPFIDGFGRGFDRGYYFYLQNKPDPDAQVFGNSLLLLGAVLKSDMKHAGLYLAAINDIPLEDVRHPFVIARYIGSNILFNHIVKEAQEKELWISKSLSYFENKPNFHGFQDFNIEYELLISEYLILSDCFQEVADILAPVLESRSLLPPGFDVGFWITPVMIMLFRALVSLGRIKEAKALLPEIGDLNWLINDYYTIQLLEAKLKITDNKKEADVIRTNLKGLIARTKFTFFSSFSA